MSEWYLFDRESDEERAERQQVIDQIAAAEKTALEACATIRRIAEDSPFYAEGVAQRALTHVATIATVEGKTVFKRADQRVIVGRRS